MKLIKINPKSLKLIRLTILGVDHNSNEASGEFCSDIRSVEVASKDEVLMDDHSSSISMDSNADSVLDKDYVFDVENVGI